jgi:prophage regulatory protein
MKDASMHSDQYRIYVSDVQLAQRFGTSRQTVWGWARIDPAFPKPVKLSPGCTRWRLAEVEAWEAAKAGEAA